jgi:hypothetical protein
MAVGIGCSLLASARRRCQACSGGSELVSIDSSKPVSCRTTIEMRWPLGGVIQCASAACSAALPGPVTHQPSSSTEPSAGEAPVV